MAAGLLDARPGFLLGLLNFGLALICVFGAPERFSAPSFDGPKAAMPIVEWGLLFLVGSIVCFAAKGLGSLGAVAVAVGGGIHAFWATCLAYSVTSSESAAATGAWVYAWLAVIHVATGMKLARQVG